MRKLRYLARERCYIFARERNAVVDVNTSILCILVNPRQYCTFDSSYTRTYRLLIFIRESGSPLDIRRFYMDVVVLKNLSFFITFDLVCNDRNSTLASSLIPQRPSIQFKIFTFSVYAARQLSSFSITTL